MRVHGHVAYDPAVKSWAGVVVAVVVLGAGCSSSHRRDAKGPALTAPTATTVPGTRMVRVSATPRQTMQGFGASGAWWPNDLVKFSTDTRKLVAGMLFDRVGLGLSGYRYNIGGGGRGVKDPTRAPHEVAGDVAGLAFLRAASAAGVPILSGFVNSAPPQFTTNGQACGGALKPGMEAAYAGYLAQVVRHLHDAEHITLRYVSPMNEPDNSFADCGQEGMKVPVEQRAAVVRALGQALARDAPFAHVIADESSTATLQYTGEVPRWMSAPDTARYVAALAHHTYDFPNAEQLKVVPAVGARFHKPSWMTEICCNHGVDGLLGFGSQYDPTMKQGFWLADDIFKDLTVAGDSAYYWWTALSSQLGCDPNATPQCVTTLHNRGWNDGLLYYDANAAAGSSGSIFPTRRYYVLGQFSRFVRPGAVRHDVGGAPPGVRVMAFAAAKE